MMDTVKRPTMETRKNIDDVPPRAISFPAGNDDFRAARNDCARACRRFNETPEDAPPEIRCKRWLDIVSPNRPASTPTNTVTLDQTFRDPSLVPGAPFVKPPLHMDYGLRVRVAATTFINRYCMIMDTPVADVIIGERCNVGPHCAILSVGHPLGVAERTGKRSSTGREVRIGDGVWIRARVTIMGGVTVGDGAVIGACSLVTRSIPPRALAYGVPAEVVRILDEEDEKADEGVASVETLEEALNARSREALDARLREAAAGATPVVSTIPSGSSLECGSSSEKAKPSTAAAASSLVSGSKKAKSSTTAKTKTKRETKTTAEEGICESPRRGRSQVHIGGVRDSHGLTRAEILASIALIVSFMGCFFFVALLVVTKRGNEASLPTVRDL